MALPDMPIPESPVTSGGDDGLPLPAPEDLPWSTLYSPALGPAWPCACGKTIFRLPSGTWLSTERPGEDDRVRCTSPANAEKRKHRPLLPGEAS